MSTAPPGSGAHTPPGRPDREASGYIKQSLADQKGGSGSSAVIVGDSQPLTSVDRSESQQGDHGFTETPDQMDLTGLYRTLHANAAEHTFFSSAHATSSRLDRVLGHRTSLDTFKKVEILSSIFSNHNSMKLETNYKKKAQK